MPNQIFNRWRKRKSSRQNRKMPEEIFRQWPRQAKAQANILMLKPRQQNSVRSKQYWGIRLKPLTSWYLRVMVTYFKWKILIECRMNYVELLLQQVPELQNRPKFVVFNISIPISAKQSCLVRFYFRCTWQPIRQWLYVQRTSYCYCHFSWTNIYVDLMTLIVALAAQSPFTMTHDDCATNNGTFFHILWTWMVFIEYHLLHRAVPVFALST